MTIEPESHIPLSSETIMMAQWQNHSDLFAPVAWSTKEGGNSRLIFTVYSLN